MKPILSILPTAQKQLWQALKPLPKHYVLYGGTAIALQIGHRESVDFDFFSSKSLDKTELLLALPFLNQARLVQTSINTLNCYVDVNDATVNFQFLAGIDKRQGRVEMPLISDDNQVYIASLRDLFATKLNTIQARAQLKDYIDIHVLLVRGFSLSDGLACAKAIFGPLFDPGSALRALSSYHDGDLPECPKTIRNDLIKAAADVDNIPIIEAQSAYLSPDL